jgi:hypothetical protein
LLPDVGAMMNQPGFFDVDRRLEAMSAKGDPLDTINGAVPWESFRASIEAVTVIRPEARKSNAGRRGYDTILKFKILVLASLYNLSDESLGYPGSGCHSCGSSVHAARSEAPRDDDLAVLGGVGGGRCQRRNNIAHTFPCRAVQRAAGSTRFRP